MVTNTAIKACSTYLLVEEIKVSSALVLGLSRLASLFLLFGVPVGLIIIPLILLTIIVSRLEVEVIAQSLVTVCGLLVLNHIQNFIKLTLLGSREGAEQFSNALKQSGPTNRHTLWDVLRVEAKKS